MTQAKHKILVLILCSFLCIIKCSAYPLYICFTNNSVFADVSFKYTNNPALADMIFGITQVASLADYNVCFVSKPTSKSIDISIINSPASADHTICITTSPIADKTFYITNSLPIADVSICFSELSTPLTTDIYVKGKDANSMTLEQKVALVYKLVMKKGN